MGDAGASRLPPGAELMLSDRLKKLVDPEYRQRERQKGLLPVNKESPFGDFPPESSIKKQSRLSAQVVPHVLFNEKERRFLRASKTANAGSAIPLPVKGWMTLSPDKGAPLPPRAGAFSRRVIEPSQFRLFYDRGELPVAVDHGASGSSIVVMWPDTENSHCLHVTARTGNRVRWKTDPHLLDYQRFLPVFFDGLREKEDPYRFLAVQGTYDLLRASEQKVLITIPQLIIPIKKALETRDCEVIAVTLRILQALVLCGGQIGEALVPYYRQILPCFNLFFSKNESTGDKIYYAQRRRENIGDLIEETLHVFESRGGPDAFAKIKYIIPVYESCIHN